MEQKRYLGITVWHSNALFSVSSLSENSGGGTRGISGSGVKLLANEMYKERFYHMCILFFSPQKGGGGMEKRGAAEASLLMGCVLFCVNVCV